MELSDFPVATMCIEPAGRRVAVRAGSTLLQAAEAAGVVLPSSCRNGTCRACICQSTGGEVFYEIAWPGLSREEKREGWVLPCVAFTQGDVTIFVPGAVIF